ncbi:alpha/beta fold hydrolase [Micromonospora sp. CPCC 205556]|uniref:alpha/beta fold hydrolase n=1 Tax=Micromonospora sp. CPCC 205556 TaxID=3122398 RepID=UPI002FF371C3
MRIRNLLSLSALAAVGIAASLGTGATSAAADRHHGPKPTVVLVHGAFADSSSWHGVVSRLQKNGYPVLAPANPLRGLSSDADYLKQLLATVSGPVVLVGHSYGGSVITNAAVGNPNVTDLVYVAAFAPDAGESVLGLSSQVPGSTLPESLAPPVPLGDGSHDLYIRQDAYHGQFAADVSPAKAALSAVTQRPVRDAALAEGSGAPAWKTIPSWFVLAGADKNIPIAGQRLMAERAGSRHTVQVDTASHSIAVSHPDVVADLIDKAATTR